MNRDTEGGVESVRITGVSVKRGSTVYQSLTTTGVQTVSLRKSTLSPDEDQQYAAEKSRLIVIKLIAN